MEQQSELRVKAKKTSHQKTCRNHTARQQREISINSNKYQLCLLPHPKQWRELEFILALRSAGPPYGETITSVILKAGFGARLAPLLGRWWKRKCHPWVFPSLRFVCVWLNRVKAKQREGWRARGSNVPRHPDTFGPRCAVNSDALGSTAEKKSQFFRSNRAAQMSFSVSRRISLTRLTRECLQARQPPWCSLGKFGQDLGLPESTRTFPGPQRQHKTLLKRR